MLPINIAASCIGISPAQLRRLCVNKRIRSINISSSASRNEYRIPILELVKFMQENCLKVPEQLIKLEESVRIRNEAELASHINTTKDVNHKPNQA